MTIDIIVILFKLTVTVAMYYEHKSYENNRM